MDIFFDVHPKFDFENAIMHRILHRINSYIMKVTAIIDDQTIKDAMKFSNATTVTDTLKIALNEYIRLHKLKKLSKIIKDQPVVFEYTAEQIRNLNRDR